MKEKKRFKWLKWVLIILLALLIGIGGVIVYGTNYIRTLENEIYEEPEQEIYIPEEVSEEKEPFGVMNIALFGVDSRKDGYTNTRTDAMMVLSYNSDNETAYVTSIVRDTYAFIDQKHGYDKINHAYAYGGPGLAVQTINQNFDLDIQKYVTVNFNAVQHLIDQIGGIEVEIKDYEIDEINRVIIEMQTEGVFDSAPTLEATGYQTLNGQQAVAYMRIRKVGNGDFERMERQRRVINLTVQKTLSLNKIKLISLINDLLPYIKTNLSTSEIIELGTHVLKNGLTELTQLQLPNTDLSYGGVLSDGVYYLVPTSLEDNIVWWHNQVYGTEEYRLSSLAERINEQIPRYSGIY